MTTPVRGHWPRGKRRHAVADDWHLLLRRMRRMVAQPSCRRRGDNFPRRSKRGLADWAGVDDHTVRRWLLGDDLPDPRLLPLIRQWAANAM